MKELPIWRSIPILMSSTRWASGPFFQQAGLATRRLGRSAAGADEAGTGCEAFEACRGCLRRGRACDNRTHAVGHACDAQHAAATSATSWLVGHTRKENVLPAGPSLARGDVVTI